MITIVSLTDAGQRLGQQLLQLLQNEANGIQHWHKPQPFSLKVQGAFQEGQRLILICATGIAVRTLAPVLVDKHQDPAVLVLDELGQFVIPLLSGHEGGANHWALEISDVLTAQLVQTTAKPYLKPVYTVGMGCERDCPQSFLEDVLQRCLTEAGLTLGQINSINSIAIKADEKALIQLAKDEDKPFDTWSVAELSTVEQGLSTKSDYIFKTVGVYGVAESAALFAAQQLAGDEAELLVNKRKNTKATCAIARAYPKEER